LIVSSAMCAGKLPCWKIKNAWDLTCMAGRNCYNNNTLRLAFLTNLDSVIDKCQAGLLSTTCYLPTDAVIDWIFIVCAGVLSRCLSSSLMKMYYLDFLANVNSRTFTFAIRYMLSPVRLSSVCNARTPYSGGCKFRQFFYGIWYLGHP